VYTLKAIVQGFETASKDRLRYRRPSIELTPDDGERDVVAVSSWTLQPG